MTQSHRHQESPGFPRPSALRKETGTGSSSHIPARAKSSQNQYCVAFSHANTNTRFPALLADAGALAVTRRAAPHAAACTSTPAQASMKKTGGVHGRLGGRQLTLPRECRKALCAKAMSPAAARPPPERGSMYPLLASQADGALKATRKDVGDEGAVGGGVVPQLGAGAEEAARQEEEAGELPARHDELDGDDDGREAQDRAVEGQVAEGHGEELGAGERAARGEAAVALAGAQRDGVDVHGRQGERPLRLGEVWDDGHRPVPARPAERGDEVVGPAEPGQEGRRCWIETARSPINNRLPIRRRALPPLDPLGLKLRAHPYEQGRGPEDAPGMHETDSVANGEISAGARNHLMEVESHDEQPEQVPRPVQPWPVDVRDGEVEYGEDDRPQQRIGDDERLDGAGGELMAEVEPVDVADVGAQVREPARHGDRHVETAD
ncbi:hypothetical protein VP1G_11328 [Cytospora mali]|uniref:Uncharacterized protein n=1 Tax=Cytospora mali TaxID=578113 RepID=A0A194VDL0_CYTMA|nr:hypothetical protein VP1G_11328 [Valsa mali var. pyri (nom. inval.)]